MKTFLPALFLAVLLVPCSARNAAGLDLDEADNRLAIADRMLEGGIYDRARELALSVLDDPAAQAVSGPPEEIREWLRRREEARFLFDRARFGLASTHDEFADIAESFVQLHNNRYRLPHPARQAQAAYWAGRAYEEMGDWRNAVEYYFRVGGATLPQDMEGDAAQRTARNLRRLADELPYPGGISDRRRRDQLLNQAIAELDRARLAFPVGNRRREIELDLIGLRMARRDEQFVREAATEAEAFIAGDPGRDELRARAVFYRGQAAALLGQPREAAEWFRRVFEDETPSDEDNRRARRGLALALVEMSRSAGAEEKKLLLRQASEALDVTLAGVHSPGFWDGARVSKARILIELEQPSAALDTLRPILESGRIHHSAWQVAGLAELERGRLGEALSFLYPATRPSNPSPDIRYAASRDASRTADARRYFGLALALNHQASRLLRESRVFSTLLESQFHAMEILLRLGRMDGPVSLSGDIDLLIADSDAVVTPIGTRRDETLDVLAQRISSLLHSGGNPDNGYDLAIAAEAGHEWAGDGIEKLELAIAMISHLRKRQPAGVTDSVLSSRMGVARHSLALARAERILAAPEPDETDIDRTLGYFAAAAASFREAAADGASLQDSLDQGMVNMESGAFLMQLAARWERGRWAATAATWREEARQRIEASLRPFNQAIATSGPSSLASRRARWSRGRALEVMGEWRGAAADYLSLMNNSELPRVLRANAARRWAVCMGNLGENRQALTRLAAFAEIDAESALLAGHLAEEAGYVREAHQRFLFAANPDSPSLPPSTPDRLQSAAYHAARLALADPREADPLVSPELTVERARALLRDGALNAPDGVWAVPMLNLLGESLMEDPEGWRAAHRLAYEAIESRSDDPALIRAMHVLAARAMSMAGNYDEALNELDKARELIDDSSGSRADAATIMLETARVYRRQERFDDALRAYGGVFAVYPEQEKAEDAARVEAATMLLTRPDGGERAREQARGILSGLRDQMLAEKLLRDYGAR